MSIDLKSLEEKFRQVYALEWESEDHPQYQEFLSKFIFHMIDAAPEIRRLASLLQDPQTLGLGELQEVLRLFFEHAVPHLVAAGQLYSDVPEIFPEQRGVHVVLGKDGENLLRKET
jgi:hypothetical protein